MKQKILFLSMVTLALCADLTSCARAENALVANAKSTFTIVTPVDAPWSLQNAAQELQKDIELATGAKLHLQKDDAKVTTPVISLGSTQQAKSAGFNSEKMADESYRIVTQNGNLFILGPDTPDGGWTKNNGESDGTANGVYSFLEDELNVRWLMPGDLGRDVPRVSTFTLGDMDQTVTPTFSFRKTSHLADYGDKAQVRGIQEWSDRQRLGGATQLSYNHFWWPTVNGTRTPGPKTAAVKALYQAHPEWFAMNATGERPLPNSQFEKLETTNPELVRWYADKAIAALKASPRPETYSLSPSDGARWSQSLESKALYDPPQNGAYDPEDSNSKFGTSSLILKWYHDVAEIVAKEYPQGRLSGYLYSSYIYPPTKYTAKLPKNFTPVIAPSRDYGYGLYRKETQDYFKSVTDSWAKVVSGDWFYYDLPNQLLLQLDAEIGENNFSGYTGIITPAAPEILDTIFPQLLKSHIKGGNIYGVSSWSNGALANYITAKMEWNPSLKAADVQREWLQRAYGPQAGATMEQFYNRLDDWFREYYQQNPTAAYKLKVNMFKDIYGAHYPEMEKLFVQAKAQPMTDAQKQRFQLLEDNLVVTQWRLRNAGFLPANFSSPLPAGDAQINALLTKNNVAFPLFPGVFNFESKEDARANRGKRNSPKVAPWTVHFTPTASTGNTPPPDLQDNQFLFYATQDGDIRITPQLVTHGIYFAVYQVKDLEGKVLSSGLLNTSTPITISAKAGGAYTLTIPTRKPVNYELRVENAALASGDFQNNTLTLSGKAAPVQVYYAPDTAPTGVFEDGNAVLIKKPYSGAMAKGLMEKGYSDVRVLDALDNGWRFTTDPKNDGLVRGFAKPDFNDAGWTPISPLDWWQNQGFPDYHGIAWYRINVTQKPLKDGERARLFLGAVDGNVSLYFNGEKVYDRILPADYKGWDKPLSIDLNNKWHPGENTLALQVTSKNDTSNSGLFKGAAIAAGVRYKPEN